MQEPLLHPDAAAQILQQTDDGNTKAFPRSQILHHEMYGSTWKNMFRPL